MPALIRAAGQHPNARWNGLITYFIHDFNNQQEPHAFSLGFVEKSGKITAVPVAALEAITSMAAPMLVLAQPVVF